MNINSIVFPAPECSYTINSFSGELIFLPRQRPDLYNQDFEHVEHFGPDKPPLDLIEYNSGDKNSPPTGPAESLHIPCLFLPYKEMPQNNLDYIS